MRLTKTGQFPFIFPDTGGNTQDYSLPQIVGIITRIIVTLPNFTNSVTATFSLNTVEGNTLLSVSSIPENATTTIMCNVEAVGEPLAARIVLSGDPGGSGGTATAQLYAVHD